MFDERKKQHFVPQFYLKFFSPEEKGTNVCCYDKENEKSFTTSTRDICREIGFYENEHKKKKPIEEAFSVAERESNILFLKVIEAEDLSVLDISEFSKLLTCLLLFKQRTKKRRNIVSDARKEWMKRINGRFTDWQVVPKHDDWERSEHLLSIIETYEEELMILCKNNWELIINKTQIPFWTSDDPIVQQLVNNDKRFPEPYVKNYFPITPKLLMHSEPLISNGARLFRTETKDEKIISNMNRLTFKNAYRFVFSRDGSFSATS